MVTMKTCKKCGLLKTVGDFYASRTDCKVCARAAATAYRQANLERVKAYDRERGLLPHRKAGVAARAHLYKGSAPNFRAANPEKYRAHNAVNNAVRDGKLIPRPCERCGYGIGVHAHHEDYSKPLDVVWLCKRHHGERHREINEERRRTG